MPLTIAGVALLGWWLAGLVPASAVLLGAVLAPTDPVLASEVQVGQPQVGDEAQEEAEEEPEVRFALTAEAGLNDGLAFPFANAALVMVVYGSHPANWLGRWLLIELLYKIAAGALIGVVLGGILGRWIVGLKAPTSLAKAMIGLGAVAATLLAYGMAELVGGYGFIAVFVAAVSMRNYERHHTYHEVLHQTSEIVERTLTALILVLLGGALVRGVLDELTPAGVAVVLLLLFVIRPAAGMLGLLGSGRLDRPERAAVSFFGIRGIGSIYYLAHALGEESFVAGAELWSLVVFAVLVSVVVHGIAAAPVMSRLESST
jgi:NhaP-type Na+/H+ or K+/H+ antiporter